MKVWLISPPVQDFYHTPGRLFPLGLAYLMGTIKQEHPEVEITIKDYHRIGGERIIPIHEDLIHLRKIYKYQDQSPFSTFYNFFHFGMSFEEIRGEMRRERPDLVAISSLFTTYFNEALKVATIANDLGIKVVMGGGHVSAVPEEVLANQEVDYVICGEGERSFSKLISALKGRCSFEEVPGIGYKKNGEMIFNKMAPLDDINTLPFPDLSSLSLKHYSYGRRPLAFVVTSRGCPRHCSFCSVKTIFGNIHRQRSVDSVMAEIEQRYAEGYRVIDFEDDCLTINRLWMKELCQRLEQEFPAKEMEFLAMNGISYLDLDKELLWDMRQANFTHLNLAIGSLAPIEGRPHSVEKYLNVVRAAKDLGFEIVAYQILGMPEDNVENMIQTMQVNTALPVLLGASPFYYSEGIPLAKKVTKRKYREWRLTSMGMEEENRQMIYSLFVSTRIINFVKERKFVGVKKISELTNKLDLNTRERFGVDILLKMARENRAFVATSDGFVINDQFSVDLFRKVLMGIKSIVGIAGNEIENDLFG